MRHSIFILALATFLSGCSIYTKYERTNTNTENLYRDTLSETESRPADTLNFLGNMSWREIFQDPLLQKLIEQGLTENTDLKVALLRMEEAEASLSVARLAYTPQLSFAPNGTLSTFNNSNSKVYGLPLSASWQVPLFGGMLNAKRKALASLEQSHAYKQAVQSQLIATIANEYFTLLKLDKQLEITEKTIVIWGQSLETMRAMKGIGLTNEAAISQSEANYHSIKLSKSDLIRQIREAENALSLVLGQVPQSIPRSKGTTLELPQKISSGVPLQMLSSRPDVKQAEMTLVASFYTVHVARSAFYPNIVLNGTLSWTNSAGGYLVNPAKFLESMAGSLTAPIFSKGTNKANLKIAKALQEEASLHFRQVILTAGNEVSNALFEYTTTVQKREERIRQIEALTYSEKYTKELFRLSSSTYLEVLTAQQGLLSAQLSETEDHLEQALSIIKLYQALGGGRE
jgi:outer membrane protein, multidrug efflux system